MRIQVPRWCPSRRASEVEQFARKCNVVAVFGKQARPEHRFRQDGSGYGRNCWPEDEIRRQIEYIHDNSVRGSLTGKPAEWYWSSTPLTTGPQADACGRHPRFPVSLSHYSPVLLQCMRVHHSHLGQLLPSSPVSASPILPHFGYLLHESTTNPSVTF